jgi:hypothetical protein
MPFWSGESLAKQIPAAGIISPFDPKQIDCNSYILSMGREAYVTPNHESILSAHTIKILNDHEHLLFRLGNLPFY